MIIVADKDSLRKEWSQVRALCWSDATIKARKSQWRRYLQFCDLYDVKTLPVDVEGICLYITHLTRTVSYVTIVNYVTGVWKLHDYLGYTRPDPTSFIISSTLRGAKRLLGAASNPALPLSPTNIGDILKTLDLTAAKDLVFWCALLLSFRCVLRVSHITHSPHQLLVKDIRFFEGGMDVTIRSSKTVQFRERTNVVPVLTSPNSILCPVSVLKNYMRLLHRKPTSPLFPLTYNIYSSKLKAACGKIGLVGHYSTHSVRRGAASYLATFLPLHDVKAYGDWRSWAVLLYLSDTYDSRKAKDRAVAERLAVFV